MAGGGSRHAIIHRAHTHTHTHGHGGLFCIDCKVRRATSLSSEGVAGGTEELLQGVEAQVRHIVLLFAWSRAPHLQPNRLPRILLAALQLTNTDS